MEKQVNGTNGGTHIAGAPLTTANTAKAAPTLLRNYIDERIVRIRPTSTPLDQISRCAGARACNSMTVEYYSVDTKKIETELTRPIDNEEVTRQGPGVYTQKMTVAEPELFEISETFLIANPNQDKDPLIGYVYGIEPTNNIIIFVPLNGENANDTTEQYKRFPAVPAGQKVVRMGRAATELDVQTAQFQALPKKNSNNCQIFK